MFMDYILSLEIPTKILLKNTKLSSFWPIGTNSIIVDTILCPYNLLLK